MPISIKAGFGSVLHKAYEMLYVQKIKSPDMKQLEDIVRYAWKIEVENDRTGYLMDAPEYTPELALAAIRSGLRMIYDLDGKATGKNMSDIYSENIQLVETFLTAELRNPNTGASEISQKMTYRPDAIRRFTEEGMLHMIELKTSGKKWNEHKLLSQFQPDVYALLHGATQCHAEFYVTILTREPYVMQMSTVRGRREISRAYYTIVQILRAIRADAFPPNESSYLCSPDYCEHFEICHRTDFGLI